MNTIKASVAVLAFVVTSPILASVTINSPANGSQVGSPFNVSASSASCSSQPVVAMGYSLDNSTDTKLSGGQAVKTSVASGNGWHTLHVKAWGNRGAACVTDVSVNVTTANSGAVPAGAASVSSLQNLENWNAVNDTGTGGGWSAGNTYVIGSPSRSGHARQFNMNYGDSGAQRFHTSFGDDTTSQNFFYDAWVYIDGTASKIGNLEMDMNQTMPNGLTVIYGVQCDGYTGTWDVTQNAGSPQNYNDQWVHTGAPCNIRSWGRSEWHHIQMLYSRDSSGNVTYKTFWHDGIAQQIWMTVPSAFALGWGPTLLTNFQIDGLGSGGNVTVLLDDLTVSRW
jgi:hypothetical protein